MKRTIIFACGIVGSLVTQPSFAGTISDIQLRPQGKDSLIEISGKDLHAYTQENKANPTQLVLTFNNVDLEDSLIKKYDASQLNGNITQVSAYPVSGKTQQSRVVVDLKKGAQFTIQDSVGGVIVRVAQEKGIEKKLTKDEESIEVLRTQSSANPVDDTLSTIMQASQEKKFTGSPITLKLKDADVHEVLRLISETSGFNIIIHPSVTGKLTLSLEQVPWDQALDVVLTTLKLGAERNESVLRVMPREMLVAEKQADIDAKKISAAAAPRVTRIFPVSYADLSQLSSLLTTFANAQNNSPGSSGVPTTIIIDQNTQSLIVRDTLENVDRIKKMIEILDVQTPQVLLESKVVEATEQFTRTIGGNIIGGGTQLASGFNGGTIGTSALTNVTGAASSKGGAFSLFSNFSISKFPISLNAVINMSDEDDTTKILSSPRTVVLSGKTSTITQAQSAYVNQTTIVSGVSQITPVTITANTKLSITPRVTNDGSVFMKLDLTKDVLTNGSTPVVNPRSIQTEVIVESGSTLVLGGVLSLDDQKSEVGFPGLRNIPIVGWLFGSTTTNKTKTELMFFITPRILNQKKSGIINTEGAAPAAAAQEKAAELPAPAKL